MIQLRYLILVLICISASAVLQGAQDAALTQAAHQATMSDHQATSGQRQAPAADYSVTTQQLMLGFSKSGVLVSASACFPACNAPEARTANFGFRGVLIPSFPRVSQPEAEWAGTSDFDEAHQILTFESSTGASVTWLIPHDGYLVQMRVTGLDQLEVRSGESFRPAPAAGFGNWLEQLRYLLIGDGGVRQYGLEDSFDPEGESYQWAGYRSRYWGLVVSSDGMQVLPPDLQAESFDVRFALQSDNRAELKLSIFMGPIEPRVLAAAPEGLQDILYSGLWFWLRWICFALFYLLDGIHQLIPVWGLAVMVLSIIVHVVMRPLSRIADRLQDQVNEVESRLAPEIAKIKSESKGEEQSNRIMALYKSEKVHPLYSFKSLAGVAVVIPVFIGAFDMLAENIYLQNATFAWIADLSRSDHLFSLPVEIPFFGASLNLLPFLMTGLSIGASLLHKPLSLNADLRRIQARNMLLLAAAFFVLFYTFPAGMVLYWTTNNLISLVKAAWHHFHSGAGTVT